MSKTDNNLKEAFAGESQANRKYLAFSIQADKEGFHQAARLFRAACEAETIHALTHFRTLGGVGNTAENLKAAVAGETFEYESMYPKMIAEAEAEGNKAALRSFNYANAAEKVHAALYSKVLAGLDKQDDTTYYVCSVCGHIHENEAPEKCPICKAASKAFKKVD